MLIYITYENRRTEYQVDANASMELKWIIADILQRNYADRATYAPTDYDLKMPGDNGDYLNDQNFRMFFRDGVDVTLKLSPRIEALESITALKSGDDVKKKKAIYGLSKTFQDPLFTAEFVRQGGVEVLMDNILKTSGNTQAYALIAFQEFMSQPHGWDRLPQSFITTIVGLLQSVHINICRPATAIAIRLVNSPKYGFAVIHEAGKAGGDLPYGKLVERINENDFELQLNSISLLNAMIANAKGPHLLELLERLDALNARRAMMRLMAISSSPDGRSDTTRIDSEVLHFQRLIFKEFTRRRNVPVDLRLPEHAKLYSEILAATGAADAVALGFRSNNLTVEMQAVGQLGLEHLASFARRGKEHLTKYVQQMQRTDGRKCALGLAAVEISKALMEHFQGSGEEYSTAKKPALLALEDLFSLAMQSLLKFWSDMEAREGDLTKVVGLVRTQLEHARKEKDCSIDHYSKALLQASYKDVQKRQLEYMDAGDDLLVKLPVRNLKERIHKDSAAFVQNQRLHCLMTGAWFATYNAKGKIKNSFRYYRLSPNKKYLHYAEFTEQTSERPPLDALPEKIDLSNVTDLALYQDSPLFGSGSRKVENAPFATNTFSLMGPEEGISLADFVAENQAQFFEWTDGLRILLGRSLSAGVANRDTLEFIAALTDFDVKLAILDIRVQQLNIPDEAPPLPPLPPNYEFVTQ